VNSEPVNANMNVQAVRGIRGAITVPENTRKVIIAKTAGLLGQMIEQNGINTEDICSIFFSATPDLNKEFPAQSARKLGLQWTPLLCMTEIPVEGALNKCIRILIHVNTKKSQKEMQHIYLDGARKLRPDLAEGKNAGEE